MAGRAGIPPELAAWYGEEYPALLRFAIAVTRDRHGAEDLVQEAFLRGCRAGLEVGPSAGPYVRRAIVNLVRNRARRREVERRFLERHRAEEAYEHPSRDDEVWATLGALSARQRAVLVLRFYEDLSEERIAEVLGISRGNVKKHTSRALEHLRTQLPRGAVHGS